MTARLQRFAGRTAAAAAALMLLAGPAFADGYKGSLKDSPKPEERCKHTANVSLTTRVLHGRTGRTLADLVDEGGYDLVVISGRRPCRRLRRAAACEVIR